MAREGYEEKQWLLVNFYLGFCLLLSLQWPIERNLLSVFVKIRSVSVSLC